MAAGVPSGISTTSHATTNSPSSRTPSSVRSNSSPYPPRRISQLRCINRHKHTPHPLEVAEAGPTEVEDVEEVEVAALRAEVAVTRRAMVATQQQMALMAQSSPQMQTQKFPAWPPAYPAAYQQPGMQQPIPPAPVPQAAYAAIPPPRPPGVSTSYGISTSTGICPTCWRWRR